MMHARAVDKESEPARPPAEKNVLADVEISAQGEVLVDHLDAEIAALVWTLEMHGLAVDRHFARIPLVGAGHNFHERRLACRIVADETEDFSRHQGQMHVNQRSDRAEALVDRTHLHDWAAHAFASLTGLTRVGSSATRLRPNHWPRMLCWRSQMSPTTAMMRMRPMNTFCHCCGKTKDEPSFRMIWSDKSERMSVITAAPASEPIIVP